MTAAVLHLAPLDLAQNELRRLRLENLAGDPSAPTTGRLFFHSGRGRLRYWAGAWHEAQRYYAGLDQLGQLAPALGVLAAGDGAAWVALAPGTDGQLLTADSAAPLGLRWDDPPVVSPEFVDDEFVLRSAIDPLRTVSFDLSALTAARTLTLPNASGTLALRSDLIGFLTGVSVDGPLTVVAGTAPRIGLGLATDGGLDDDSFPLRLKLASTSGLRTTLDGLAIYPRTAGGLDVDAEGVLVLLAPAGGLRSDANGLSVRLGAGLAVDDDGAVVTLKDSALDDLTDVDIVDPTDDQVLKRRGGRWVNGSAPGGTGSGDFSDQFLMMGA